MNVTSVATSDVSAAAPSNAVATSIATGAAVQSSASATSGGGIAAAGPATATAIGNGTSGAVNASASTTEANSLPTTLVTGLHSSANATVVTSATALAELNAANNAPAFVTNVAAIGSADYNPADTSKAVRSVFSGNGSISAAFGASASVFATGELGAAHATAGTGAEASTASVSGGVNASALVSPGELVLGLYGAQVVDAAGITGVTLSVTSVTGGSLTLAFTGPNAAAEATAAFNDQAYTLAVPPGTGGFDFSLNLTVTTDQANAGFYGSFIIGDTSAADAPAGAIAPAAHFVPDCPASFGGDLHGACFTHLA